MRALSVELKKAFKNAVIVVSNTSVRIMKVENPKNFLEIYHEAETGYGINVVAGTINKPSTALNGKWYNLGNKYYTDIEVVEICKMYGIE